MYENEPGGYPPEAFDMRAMASFAFGPVEFERDLEAVAGYLPERERTQLNEGLIRRKTGYDAKRECNYEVIQLHVVVRIGENEEDTYESMIVDWSDGFVAAVDLTSLHTSAESEGEIPEEEVRARIMSALIQLVEL